MLIHTMFSLCFDQESEHSDKFNTITTFNKLLEQKLFTSWALMKNHFYSGKCD